MRALRRIATPASVAVAIGGCNYPFDDYLPQQTDAGLTTNATSTPQRPEDTGTLEDTTRDSGVYETAVAEDTTVPDTEEPDTFVPEVAVDTAMPEDTRPPCTCVKYAGGKCREWSPPGCGD